MDTPTTENNARSRRRRHLSEAKLVFILQEVLDALAEGFQSVHEEVRRLHGWQGPGCWPTRASCPAGDHKEVWEIERPGLGVVQMQWSKRGAHLLLQTRYPKYSTVS